MRTDPVLSESFRVLTEFKGFGEPSSRIWFVGIEEGHQWTLEELRGSHVDPYRQRLFELDGFYDQDGRRHATKVYPIASRIAVALLRGQPGVTGDPDDFQKRRLGRRKSDTFLTNLYPLGKTTRASWPEHYNELGFSTAAECRSHVSAGRFSMLRALWEKYQPRLVICHGAKEWPSFETCFSASHEGWHEETLPGGQPTRWQPGLVLTQFFGIRPSLFRSYADVPAVVAIAGKAMLT